MHADSIRRAPFDVTAPLYDLGPYKKREIVRDANGAFDLNRCAGVREIADNAIDTGGEAKNNRATFKRPLPRRLSPFFHGASNTAMELTDM